MEYRIISRTRKKDLNDHETSKSNYYFIRDKAWEFLIEYQISELPVKLVDICKKIGLRLAHIADIKSPEILKELKDSIGAIICVNGKDYLVYDHTNPLVVQRFTIAHELGHWYLGHNNSKPEWLQEREANMFAARILMPVGVLHAIEVKTKEDIMELCSVSPEAATFRLMRIKEKLDPRGKYYTSPLEQKVMQNFKEFIKQNKR